MGKPTPNLIHPIVMKKKHAGTKLPLLPQNLPLFQWTSDHQEAFDKLKLALTTAPVLAYPDYNKPFVLEMDTSLKGLGAVLLQEDVDGNFCIISYASCMLKPYERSMHNYSSAKLELLALKWSVCEKFRDYLIGHKFTILTDNNPLTYVCTSRLGASQIHWLSDITLFDFDIKYRVWKSNLAADALSRRPVNPKSSSKSPDDEEEWETIFIWIQVNYIILFVKQEVPTNTMDIEEANYSEGFSPINVIDV